MTQQDLDSLLRDRDFHAEKLREIDAELRKVLDDISKRIGSAPRPFSPATIPVPYPVPFYPWVRREWPFEYCSGPLTISNTRAFQTAVTCIAKADA